VRVDAVTLVLRRGGFFHTGEAIIHRRYGGFTGFPVHGVKAAYRSGDLVPGYGVAVVMKPSQVDLDFCMPVWFPSEDEVLDICEAMDRSDELTAKILSAPWKGKRPLVEVELTYRARDFIHSRGIRRFVMYLQRFLRAINAERCYVGRRGDALQLNIIFSCPTYARRLLKK